jgi:hypothetical protein
MMQKTIQVPVGEVVPSVSDVLGAQGIPRWVQPDERTTDLAHSAISLYKQKANPCGILMEIGPADFRGVFEGEGRNEKDSPVNSMYRMSDDIALFAVTIGEDVCREIAAMFACQDFAAGLMLDAAASEGTEMTAQAVENFYRQCLKENGRFGPRLGILRFSPGYCGWHITAQKYLFAVLRPDRIGITLNESCLMQPIKSISGVIISGRKEIFDFEDVFSFCRDCATHTCRERVRAMF